MWTVYKLKLKDLELKEDEEQISSAWVFLLTHGMMEFKFRVTPSLLIDVNNDKLILELDRYDESFAEYLLAHPISHLSVDLFRVLKLELEDSKLREQPYPWSIHKRIKKYQVMNVDVKAELNASCLSFYSASMDVSRLGLSQRIASLQSALAYKIGLALDLIFDFTPSRFLNVNEVEEEKAALLAFASGILRAYKLNSNALLSEMTTSILTHELEEKKDTLACYARKILKKLVEVDDSLLEVKFCEGRFELTSKGGILCKEIEFLSSIVLGRLNAYPRVHKNLIEKVKHLNSKSIGIIIDFSEQMSLCDAYLLAALLPKVNVSKIYLLATPLNYPVVELIKHYLINCKLENLEKSDIKLMLTSEDPKVASVLASYITKNHEKEPLVYLAAGATSHVLSFGYNLKREAEKKSLKCKIITFTPI